MSAVLAPAESGVAAAREALDAAKFDLAALDHRVALYQRDLDEREMAQAHHRNATIAAVTGGTKVPKPPKTSAAAVEADAAIPILRAQRVKLTERVADCEGVLRRACVEAVERRHAEAAGNFAEAARTLIDAWGELLGTRALLDQAGVRGDPLPPSLFTNFAIPALRRMRPICENHWAHFLAEHALAQGEVRKAMHRTRVQIERDIAMQLPW